MTEKEKMLAGELYMASDKELFEEHLRAQKILRQFNQSEDDLNRSEILKPLFGKKRERTFVLSRHFAVIMAITFM